MGCQTSAVGREDFSADRDYRRDRAVAFAECREEHFPMDVRVGIHDRAPAVKGSGKMSKVAQQHHSQQHVQKLESLRDWAKTAQEDRQAEVDITALRPLVGVLLVSDYMYIKRCQAKRLSTIRESLGEKTLQ
jgi:hypothetical protein